MQTVTSVIVKVGNQVLVLKPTELRDLASNLNDLIQAQPSVANKKEPIAVDFNAEPWPNNWAIDYGVLKQKAVLTISI